MTIKERRDTTMSNEPLAAYTIRVYREEDREKIGRLGTPVIDWWHARGPEASLHLVAATSETGAIVGHLQAVDRSVPAPSRRPGQCHFNLNVAPEHRLHGIGGALYARTEAFARQCGARLLYTAYCEHNDAPGAPFLKARGFEPLERFLPSYLDLEAFDPQRFDAAIERVEAQGIRLLTYADLADAPENRRRLYELEQSAHATQPFREVGPYLREPYEEWEQELMRREPATIFLALAADGTWTGVVTGL